VPGSQYASYKCVACTGSINDMNRLRRNEFLSFANDLNEDAMLTIGYRHKIPCAGFNQHSSGLGGIALTGNKPGFAETGTEDIHLRHKLQQVGPRSIVIDRGRESVSSPSLRTGQALFTHPALQLMGSISETEVFECMIGSGAISLVAVLRSG
jgi:hypothetical protein